jgi:hypothetical protein
VLRDERGHVKSSFQCGALLSCSAADIAEALACLQGLKQIVTNCNVRMQVESDYLRLINELCAVSPSRSGISDIVKNIKAVGGHFPGLVFPKTPRDSNCLATRELSTVVACGVLYGSANQGVRSCYA